MNSGELFNQAVTSEEQEEFTAYLIKLLEPKDQKDFEDKIKSISPEEIYEIYKEYKRMKDQISYAKSGSKLLHINELRGQCPEGYEVEKFLSGGCVKCKKKAIQKDLMNGIKDELRCGGKMKKRVIKKALGSKIKKLGPGDSTSAGSVKPNKKQARTFKAQNGMPLPTTWEEIYSKYFTNGEQGVDIPLYSPIFRDPVTNVSTLLDDGYRGEILYEKSPYSERLELRQPIIRKASQNVKESSKDNGKSFAQAFKEARKAGLKEFEWQGKKYTTKLKSENSKTNEPISKVAPIKVFPKLLHSSPMFPDSLSYTLPEGKTKQKLGNQVIKIKVKNK